jgi:hypothetical protein
MLPFYEQSTKTPEPLLSSLPANTVKPQRTGGGYSDDEAIIQNNCEARTNLFQEVKEKLPHGGNAPYELANKYKRLMLPSTYGGISESDVDRWLREATYIANSKNPNSFAERQQVLDSCIKAEKDILSKRQNSQPANKNSDEASYSRAKLAEEEGIRDESINFPSGERYKGFTKNRKFHGKGRLDMPNGNWFDGYFENGNFISGRVKSINNGNGYEGEAANGKQHGWGKVTWASGPAESYEGNIVNGERTGRGKVIFRSGAIYEGDVVKDIFNGYGKLTYSDGGYVEGNFANGQPSGRATSVFKNGDKYVGDFLAGKPHGHGTWVAANGNRGEGEFADGKLVKSANSQQAATKSDAGDVLFAILGALGDALQQRADNLNQQTNQLIQQNNMMQQQMQSMQPAYQPSSPGLSMGPTGLAAPTVTPSGSQIMDIRGNIRGRIDSQGMIYDNRGNPTGMAR